MKRLALLFMAVLMSLCGLKAQINTDHMMMVGRNALYFKDYVLSIQYFNQVINAKPYLYDPYFFRGMAKFYLDDFGGAESDCSEAIERNPFIADCYQIRALSRIRLGKYDEAVSDYRQALAFDPENEGLMHNLSLCYCRMQQFDEALGVLDTLRRVVPSYTPALNMRARIHLQKNDTIAAYADLSESLKQDKYDPDVYSVRALLYMQQQKYAEAEEDLSSAIYLQPSSGDYVNRAVARCNQQNLRGAMADYDTAIDLDPNNFLGHFNRGLLRAQVGDDNRAIEDFDFVIEVEPDNVIAIYNRALLRAKTGDYQGAEEDFTEVLTAYPNFLEGYYFRADVRARQGKMRQAEEDRLVVMRSQLAGFSKSNTQTASKDEKKSDEDDNVRKKSDKNMKKYKSYVVADNDLGIEENEYDTGYRGKVQNRNVHVELLPLYAITCYEQRTELSAQAMHYHRDLDALNRSGLLPRPLVITSSETPLTNEQIDFHFADIDAQTVQVANASASDEPNSALPAIHWFARGLDFYLVQDLVGAIADFSSAIAADGTLWVSYFNRALARYKQAQIDAAERVGEVTIEDAAASSLDSQMAEYQLCLADYSKVVDLAPDFPYAYYNRANIYALMHDYQAAVVDYNEVIRMNPTFAEAYYNRGLTRLYLGQNEAGIADLSKAGELGLVSAYNLIKRFSE